MDVDLKVIRHTTLLDGADRLLVLDVGWVLLLVSLLSVCMSGGKPVGSSWPVMTSAAALPSQYEPAQHC